MLNRRPEGVELARSLGLDVVHPAVASSRIWTRGELRPLPRTLLGAPLDLDQLAASGVLSAAGLARAGAEVVEPVTGDPTVGELVAARFGDEVTDRLVEPLLGGVYAGRAREISARAAAPQLVALAERGSILEQAGALPVDTSPVFAGLVGGMGGLVEALAAGLDVRTGRAGAGDQAGRVRRLRGLDTLDHRQPAGDRARGPASSSPCPQLRPPGCWGSWRRRPPASWRRSTTRRWPWSRWPSGSTTWSPTDASGFLVPPVDGRRIKASTFSFAKWQWVGAAGAAAGVVHLRTSIGRHREEASLQVTDAELVAGSLADLGEALGLRATPVDTHVQRWGGGLPQYAVGHLDRVARIRADVARVPGLAVCGAAYDGVGIAAVIASAHRAAADLGAAQ